MPLIQNISDEKQLVRVQGKNVVINPGEIAEVTESESEVVTLYKSLFQLSQYGASTVKTEKTLEEKIAEFTKKEFKDFAKKEFGIDLNDGQKKDEMIIAFNEAKTLLDDAKNDEDDNKDLNDENDDNLNPPAVWSTQTQN